MDRNYHNDFVAWHKMIDYDDLNNTQSLKVCYPVPFILFSNKQANAETKQ